MKKATGKSAKMTRESSNKRFEMADPKAYYVAQSLCRLVGIDCVGNERQGGGFLAMLRLPLKATRYGIVASGGFFIGRDEKHDPPTVQVNAVFDTHAHPSVVSFVLGRDITNWFVSKKLDLVFLELRPEMEFLRRESYNFLPLSPDAAMEGQRLMVFRLRRPGPSALATSELKCVNGKVVQMINDNMFRWQPTTPNLPCCAPVIALENFKVIGVHQSINAMAQHNENTSPLPEQSVSVKAFATEMLSKGFLQDSHPLKSALTVTKISHQSQSSPTVGMLIRSVSNLRSVSMEADKNLHVNSIRDSPVITENLKNGICNILERQQVSAFELVTKPVDELKKLFHHRDHFAAIMAWRRHLESWKEENLEIEAPRLHMAARLGDLATVSAMLFDRKLPSACRQFLVEHEDAKNFNNTPLLQAALYGHTAIVEFLAKYCEANVFARDSHELGSSAVHLAASYGHIEIVELLTAFRPELTEMQNSFGDTPLNRAAAKGQIRIVKLLTDQRRANVENKGEHGRTPLLTAAAWGHLEVVEFLVKRGANFYAKDAETESMVSHLAAYFGHAEVVAFLYNALPETFSVKNANGKTPLARARGQNKINIVRFLESRGCPE